MAERIFERLTPSSGVYFDGTLVERKQTPFQLLEVYDTPDLGRIFRLDGFNMTSERDEFFYHENLVHPAAVAHAHPKRALVIGGGDGGSSEELLKHSTLEVVHMAELDPVVIETSRAQFGRVHRNAFDDPRLKVTVGDGLAYLRETEVRYDLVSMDLTDPVGPSVELYSPATFALAKRAMKSLFVLSTRTTHWFIERGFLEVDRSRLPDQRQAAYNDDRRSKVFVKEL